MDFLIALTIKSTLIILLSSLLMLVLRKHSATLRHWIISLTMIGLLGLPLFIQLLPSIQVEVPFVPAQPIPMVETETKTVHLPQSNNEKIVTPIAPISTKIVKPTTNLNNISSNPITLNPVIATPIEAKQSSIPTIPLPILIGVIWLLGACFFFLKFLLGLYHVWSITRNSQPFAIPDSLSKSLTTFTNQKVQFLVNTNIRTPMTWGAFQPVVLLPTAAYQWMESELNAVLVHELSHIKRRDYWVHTFGLLAVCLYWYNPLIWWMKKQQLLEREKACDEAVLRSGVQRQNYAEQLLQITRCLKKQPNMLSENALPMAKVSQLKKRIVAILNFEDGNYQFSIWKQWQWGAFFGALFPFLAVLSPIGQQILQEHFPVTPLETVTHYLDTKELSATIETDLFTERKEDTIAETQLLDSLSISSNNWNNSKHGNALIAPHSLQTLPLSLETNSLLPTFKIHASNNKTGLMGQWKDGSSEFKIWTYGKVKTLDAAPYFEILSPDGFIFIEEYTKGFFGGKVHQLTLAKAPYHLIEHPSIGKDLNLSKSPVIRKGELIKIWSNNKGFLFFEKNMDKWIADKVKNIALTFEDKKQQDIIQEKSSTDQAFNERIQQINQFIDFLYLSQEEAMEQKERLDKIAKLIAPSYPYKSIPAPTTTTTTQILGRQIPIERHYSGIKGMSPVGRRFNTLIKGGKEATVLKDFNFHLGVNTFNSLEFELTLYQVVDGNIQHTIVQQPIPISVEQGAGWIRKDLSKFNIVSKGDILVMLENTGFLGPKRGRTLYLSIDDDETYEPLLKESTLLGKKFWERKFWELPFIMYLTAEGEGVSTSALPHNSDRNNQKKKTDPKLQEQIHSRLVNLHQVSDNNENFDGYERLKAAIGDAEIVTLGEQTHGDATTFETKIKLIKYLHQEMGFDILAFESDFYEGQRTWSMIEEGHDVKNSLGKSIFPVWSTLEELNPLYSYVENKLDTDRPLMVTGFDYQMMGRISRDHFINDLKSYFSSFKDASSYNDQFYELQAFLSLVKLGKIKTFKKNRAVASIAFLKELSEQIKSKPLNEQSSFWLQSIKSLELFISDMKLGTDFREQQMAENLVWLKEKYPNKKIICWGATSHFLYNAAEVRTKSKVVQLLAANYYKKQRMMGDYLKEKYGDNIYTIGFTAYEGVNGYSLKPPPPNSVEYLIGTAKADNYFLPLHGLSLEGYMSRPLGNKYMTNDIAQVMDGVIFNRKMKLPYIDWDFFMYVVPENRYIPKKLDRLKKYQQKSKDQAAQK